MGKMGTAPELYGRALTIAAEAEEEFLRVHRENKLMGEDLRRIHYDLYVLPATIRACAMEDMVAQLFGVGSDEVAQSVHLLMEARGALD